MSAAAAQATASGVFPQDASPLPYPDISFEFFPPRNQKMEDRLWGEIRRLEPLDPRFVSVTYGAGGSTREVTQATVLRICEETSLKPAAHLTCVGTSRGEVQEIAQGYWDAGVRHIVALRGDPQESEEGYRPHPDGYPYAADLVAGLKEVADFEISVAAYPERHPESESWDQDIDNLKRKLDAGASRAITQFFFDPEVFLRFLDRVRAAGIDAPIVPGILPILDFEKTKDFAARCGATIPSWLPALFDGLAEDPDTRGLVAAVAAAEQCRHLQAYGITEFHFYTLNRAELSSAICRILRTPVAAIPYDAPATGRAARA